MNTVLLNTGAMILIIWGTAHIIMPTRSVIDGFGPISADNKRT